MEDTLQNNRDFKLVCELGKLLEEHRAIDVMVMDMRPLNFWTDFFVLATVMSSTHLLGLERHIKDFVKDNGLEIIRSSGKPPTDYEWHLMDLGNSVVHLMTANARAFYELERLWGQAPLIYKGSTDMNHSSNSS